MDVVNSLHRAARSGNLKRVLELVEDDLVDINASNNNGLTVMHSACKEGHTRIVEELLARGANVQARTLKGNQPIHIASLAGHEPVVRVLLDNGADVNAQSTSGFTSLYMAAQENHESIVRLLLERGADQNISTIDGFTPLAVSLQQNHENIAKILLSHEARGQVRFPGVTDTGRSLLHVAAKKNDCAAAALLLQNNISADITSKSNFTSLHVACHYGNEAVAKLLIDNGADVNYQAKQNITPLHVAARWNQCDMVNLLLDNGAKIDARTKDHLTPLHCAARMGHDACVELLIARGAPISAKTRSHLVPLHMSAQGNHLRSAQILLNNRAPVDDVTIDHLTSLHVASHCGHVKVAKLLLDHKADPNLRAQNGFTSLHIACKKNHLEIVKLLIKYGASLKAVTESGLSCLHIASFMGCVEIVIYLLDHKADIEAQTIRGETPLILATRSNQLEVIDVLLRYGANANACDQNHQNALHLAARLGNAKIAKLLIDRGIDINAPTRQMYTALHIASKENHENVVALMLDHGANILCATRNHEFLPLHLASKYGNDRIVELLLDYGAPVDARGKNDVTSLMVASHYDHPRVVELLLSFGASPHAIAKNGYTAIHIAAKGNRIDCAHTLLQNGADPNVESKAGFCPLHLASQEGRADMAALLLDSGAQVSCRAKNGITPLHLCAQEDHVNVAQLLVKYGAILDAQTRNGFTPLHVACHFTRLRMIRFLLANGADVNIPAASGYTSLHQASQQGNSQIVALLLEYNAQPGALTDNGHSALSIAENLGHVSVIDTLRIITETVIKTTKTTITEEKFKIVAPETMQETFVSDSEDEADDTPAHQETVRFLTTDVMRSFNANNTMASEDNYNTSQSNIAPAAATRRQRSTDREDELAALAAEQQLQLQQQQQMAAAGGANQQATRPTPIADEMSQDLQYLSREAPLDGGESTFGAYSTLGGSQLVGQQRDVAQQQQQLTTTRTPTPGDLGESQSELENDYEHTTDFRITGDDGGDETNGAPLALVGAEQLARQQQRSQQQLEQLAPDNVDIQRPLQQAGLTVSFMSTTTMDEELQRAAEGEMLRADGGDSDPADSGQPIGAPLIDCELELEPGEQNKANQPLAHLVEPATRPKSALSATRHLKPFLVSFMVDARGGAMRGCRHSGVRVIIPPNSAPQPMRITCRYLRRERLVHPPPLMEGEACASKIMEVGPAGAKFLGPVLIEVPHFASLRGKEREIIILRSDSGEVWREHLVETDDELIDSILHSAELVEQQQQQENNRPVSPAPGGGLSDGGGGDSQQQQEKRLTRIVTTEFPQYFAIISRIRQEVHTIGPDGSVVDSQVVPRVQAIFTDGALTKRIKIGLQKKDASTEQVQDGSEEFVGEDRARSPTSAGRPGSSAGKRRSRFLACFGGKHGSQEFGLDQQATDGELGFASGSNDDSPASSTGGDSPRHQHAVGANGKPLVGGGHRRVADVSDSEGDSLTLERQQRVRGPPHRRRSLVAGELVPEDYYIEREPALILNVEPKTYGKRMASSSAQTDSAKSGNLSTSTKQKGRRGLLLGARRSRSKTPMQIPFYEQEQEQSSQNNNKRPKSTDPGASTAYSSLESNGGDHEPDNGVRSSLSDLSEVGGATSTLPEVSKFRTCTVQTDSDSVTVQYVTLAAMPADASKVLSATTTTGGVGGLDDGYVSGSGDAKKASLYQQQSGAKKSFLSSCVSTGDDNESSPSSIAKRKGDKKGRGKSSDRARTLESVRESAGSTEPGGRRSVSLSRAGDSPTAGKLVETITTTTTTTMSQFLDAPTAATGDETLSNGEEADESLLTSTHSGGKVSPSGAKGAAQKKKLSKAEKVEKLRLKELERQRQRELEAAEKARKKAEKEARKEAERLEKLERKSGSRAQSPAPTTAEQRPQVITSDSEGNTLNATTTKVTQNVKFAPSPNKDYRSELQREEVSDELVATPEVDEQQVSPTSSESEKTSSGKSKGSASSKFKIKLPKISLGGSGGGKSGSVDPNEETTTIERVIKREEFVPPTGQIDEDNSLVHVSIGDATVAEPKVAAPSDEEAEDKHQLVTSSTVESQTTTSSPHIAETQEIKQVAVPLKPILKHQQSTVSEVSEEPRSLASLADRVVTKATQEAVRELDQTEGQMVTTVTTSEISTSNFRTSAETISVSESKREQARRIKAEKERRKAERDQVKLEMKIKHEEEKRLLKDAQRAAKQAEEAAKRAEHEAKRADTLARVEAERQAQIAQVESERTIREIEAREASQSSEAPTTSSGDKTKVKKAKKQKKSKVPKEEEDTSVERVEKETKTETSEFYLKGEQPQEGQVVASSLITSEQPRTDTPTSSTNSKMISIGLPKISLDLGRKKRQVSQDEAPAEQAEPVVSDEQITIEAKPETGLEQLITPHEEPMRPPSPTASKKKQKKVRAKPRGMRMNCFRGRRPTSSASNSTEDLTKSRADKQVEVTRETTEEQIEPKPTKEKKGKMKARSKKDKEEAARKRDRRASETAESQEQEPSVERTKKSRGFLSRIFRPRSPRARSTSPKQRQVELIRSQEESHFDLPKSKQADREQIVSEMYPSDPNNADGEMILEVNVPEELIREHQQPSQGDLTVTKTSHLGDVGARPESPPSEQPPSQQQVDDHVTSTTAPTFATSEDQEATLVNVSQLAADEEADEDEATENVVSQTQELPRDQEPVAPVPAPVPEHVPAHEEPPTAVESDDEKVEVTRVITEEQIEEPSESKEVTREVLEQVENVPDPKREKERKELEAKLEKEAKKRAKEDEKLRKKREKEEAKLAVLEAKRAAKEEKERVKREASEAKRLAELAKRESKRASKTEKKTVAAAAGPVSSQVATTVEGEQGPQEPGKPTTITTTTITTSSTTQGDESALNTQLDSEAGERVLASSSTSEVPVNEETEVERIVEEVMGEDGTMTKTTKVVETKYVTMRQEEVRVAERKDIPREEWERIQAERIQPSGSGQQQVAVVTTSGRTSGSGDIIETYRTQKHYIVREPSLSYPTPELDEIRATPSYFDPAQLPAEIKPQTSIKKQFAKRVRLNQRIIKRAQKLSRSEAKKAKRDQWRAESEIAVCDCAARQARKELKRAVQEAKRAVKEAEKRHKKMDKIDKEIAKRQKKLEKRQKKIDKKLAKLAKKQAKKQAKLEKKALKGGAKRSSSSSKSIRIEDIGAPVLRSSSRASIQQLAAGGSPGSSSGAAVERHLIITEEGTRTHVMRQSSQDSQVSNSQVVVTRSPETIIVDEAGGQHVVDGPAPHSGTLSTSPEVPMSLDDATLMVQQEQQQLAHRESIGSASGGQLTGGGTDEQQEQDHVERFKREAEHAAAMQRELEAAREEDDEVIDVVNVDEDKPEEGGESVETEISGAQPAFVVAKARGAMVEHKLEQEPEQQENEPPVDVEAQGADASESQEQEKQDSSNGGTPSKKSKKNKKKKQKSTESAS